MLHLRGSIASNTSDAHRPRETCCSVPRGIHTFGEEAPLHEVEVEICRLDGSLGWIQEGSEVDLRGR